MVTIDTSTSNRHFYKKLVVIALPIAVQSLITSSLSLVDNLMVSNLGEVEISAVGAAVQVYFIHWMFLFGFNSGTATFNAQFWGKRDLKSIRKTIGFGIKVSVLAGICFFAVCNIFAEQIMHIWSQNPEVIEMGAEYIRIGSPCFLFLGVTQPFVVALKATQQTKLPLFISVVSFTTNTCLNYILIFGAFGAPRLETAGAAIATVIARFIEMSLILYVVFGRKNKIAGKISEFRGAGRDFWSRIVKNAVPTTLNEVLWGGGHSMYMAAIGHMAAADIATTAYAAAQVSNTIENLFILAGFSLGDAALILLGEKLGAGEIEESIPLAKRLMKVALVVGAISGLLMILLSRLIIGWFDLSPLGEEYALKILFIYGIFLVPNLYNGVIITGVLRGGGDTKFAAIAETATIWIIGVPLAFLAAVKWSLPVYLVILCVKAEDITKCIILTYRFLSLKWAKNVIGGMGE